MKKKTYYGDTTLPDLHFIDKKKRDVCGKQYFLILACVSITCRDYLITYGDLGQKIFVLKYLETIA